MSLSQLIQYTKDIKYATQNFETGFSRKDVVEGYFIDNDLGQNQKLLYGSMLGIGFKRTPWQIVFPGQTAGLIRKIKPHLEGINEMHVRFYSDGIISAELEHGRFSLGHWRRPRENGNNRLVEVIDDEIQNIPPNKKEEIKNQIQYKDPSAISTTEFQMPDLSVVLASAFLAVQYPITTAAAIYCISKGEFYFALEPGFLSLIETPVILGMMLSKTRTQTRDSPSDV